MNSTPPDSSDYGFPESPRQDSNWPPRSPPPDNEGPDWEGYGPVHLRLYRTFIQMVNCPMQTLEPEPSLDERRAADQARSFAVHIILPFALLNVTIDVLLHLPSITRFLLIPLVAFLMPLLIWLGLHINSAITHLGLMITKGNSKEYYATYRVIAYSYAIQPLVICFNLLMLVVLFVGHFLHTPTLAILTVAFIVYFGLFIWMITINVLGCIAVHNSDGSRSTWRYVIGAGVIPIVCQLLFAIIIYFHPKDFRTII